MIKQEGDKYKLYSSDGTKVLGTHSSREDALKQERAIQMHKHASETLEKVGKLIRFIIAPMGPKGENQIVEVPEGKRTLGDLGVSDIYERRFPGLGGSLKDVPFFYNTFDDQTNKISQPSIHEVMGQEQGQRFLDMLDKHKREAGIDANVSFINTPAINGALASTKSVRLGQLDPYVAHHELGHIAHDNPSSWGTFQRGKKRWIPPAIVGLAALAEKVVGGSPLLKGIRYAASAMPLYNQYYVESEEEAAANESLKFIKENYTPEEYEIAKKRSELGLTTYRNARGRRAMNSLLMLAGNILMDKTVMK